MVLLSSSQQQRQQATAALESPTAAPALAASPTSATREVDVPDAVEGSPEIVLYQYDVCPFCNKVRAFLDFARCPYRVVEVNPLFKREIKFSSYRKVPIARVDGKQVNGSDAVIDAVYERVFSTEENTEGKAKRRAGSKAVPRNSSLWSQSDLAKEEEAKWRHWVDDHLVHLTAPNIYRTWQEALDSFNYITEQSNFSAAEALPAKYVGAVMMFGISRRLRKKYNISDHPRKDLYQAVRTWNKALGERKFLGGTTPNRADLSVFGVLRSLEGYQTFDDLRANVDLTWYDEVKKLLPEGGKSSARLNPVVQGARP